MKAVVTADATGEEAKTQELFQEWSVQKGK